ncbi:MAG: hypothetical protein GJU73_04590 [Ferrovum sp.]|jgi:hypothetical protein|uniref:hypothetical protein n=1 Tax=Ferrovum sp. TaxID=2609467 RepID=UPI00261C6373|nr:hypothetical protein [Ferrovum sp.]MBW8066705.1 hypothetical protein [Ferrovum sp.]
MSPNSEPLRPPSLAQHFDAPEDYTGHFGWLCGYSADALFLDDATERFTRLTRSQRAHQGRIALAVLLDPGNPPVSLKNAPGVAHLPIKDYAGKPFRLLHAKVALLGFRHQEHHSQWQLRLLISTGNWTRQTLEESLDLVWRIDIPSESLSSLDADIERDCADIKAAWDLMAWIQKLFDTRLLNASTHGRHSETMNALTQVIRWINTCSKKAQGQSRVFDNRGKSLLSQLPEKIKVSGEVKRNYLAIGSGFYETSDDPQKPPEVPLAILKTLRDEGLLTGKPEIDLYVNPNACQAIATSQKPLQERGITVRPATIPTIVFGESARRNLHAKFLFSANYRDNSNTCTSAWVYLGSGNLTHPGFANQMSTTTGNLEAGVVFAPSSLYWQKDRATPESLVVTNLMPIQWDEEIGDTTPLLAGSGMEQRDVVYVAPPVTWLAWHEVDGVRELRTDDSRIADVAVLDSTGVSCPRTKTGFKWCEAQPREVSIRWKAEDQPLEARIPVVDQYGRIAATELPAIDIDEAWWQLADFPMPPNDDGGDDGNGRSDKIEGKDNKTGHSVQIASYPIRQMMDLIESIAAKQTEIDEIDWPLWCNRLEQTLGQAGDSAPVKYFRDELKLNPLSPLRYQSFRPSFADTSDSETGKLYDDTLVRIEESWKVNELSPIGGAK